MGAEVCEHGGLKRRCDSCYVIKLEAELEVSERKRKALAAEVKALREFLLENGTSFNDGCGCCSELDLGKAVREDPDLKTTREATDAEKALED